MLQLRFKDPSNKVEVFGRVLPGVISDTWVSEKGNKIDLVTLISNLSAPEISGDKADLKTLQYSLSEAVRAKKKLLEKINAEVNNIQSALDVIKLE